MARRPHPRRLRDRGVLDLFRLGAREVVLVEVGVMESIVMVVGRLLLILLRRLRHQEDTRRIHHRLLVFPRSNRQQRL